MFSYSKYLLIRYEAIDFDEEDAHEDEKQEKADTRHAAEHVEVDFQILEGHL